MWPTGDLRCVTRALRLVTVGVLQVAELAKELGLKPHKVKDGEGKEVELFSPVETKGILGSDDRYAAASP